MLFNVLYNKYGIKIVNQNMNILFTDRPFFFVMKMKFYLQKKKNNELKTKKAYKKLFCQHSFNLMIEQKNVYNIYIVSRANQ